MNSLLSNSIDSLFSGKPLSQKIDSIWYIYQLFSLLPIFYALIHRFYNQLPLEDYLGKNNQKKKFPSFTLDRAIKLALIIPLFYCNYLTISTIMSNQFTNFPILIKNITSLILLWLTLNLNYYPWFVIFPIDFYSLNNCLNLSSNCSSMVFLFSIGICVLGLSQNPWRDRKNYNAIRYLILVLVLLNIINYYI